MNAWLSRNTVPIVIVLAASAAVVGIFELLDAFATSTPVVDGAEGAELEGAATIAGLIKVVAFLVVGAALTMLVRRRLRTDPTS